MTIADKQINHLLHRLRLNEDPLLYIYWFSCFYSVRKHVIFVLFKINLFLILN